MAVQGGNVPALIFVRFVYVTSSGGMVSGSLCKRGGGLVFLKQLED